MFNEYSLVKDHINKCIRNFNCYYTDFKFLIFPVTSYIIYLCDKYKIHPNFITICAAIFSFFLSDWVHLLIIILKSDSSF